jgi:chromosome segregation protein
LYGAFVWALNNRKRRFPDRAVSRPIADSPSGRDFQSRRPDRTSLGYFATAEQAALAYSRYLGPEASVAAVHALYDGEYPRTEEQLRTVVQRQAAAKVAEVAVREAAREEAARTRLRRAEAKREAKRVEEEERQRAKKQHSVEKARAHAETRQEWRRRTQVKKEAARAAKAARNARMAHEQEQILREAREWLGANGKGAQAQVRKTAKLAQKLGQLQPFIAVFPLECMGQLASFGPT